MKISEITGQGSHSFQIEKNTASLRIENIKATATIRIDSAGEDVRQSNVIPEMTVAEIVDIAIALSPQKATVTKNVDSTAFTSVVIPLSLFGILEFSDSRYYEVNIKGLGNTSTKFYKEDALKPGRAIVVKKHSFDADDIEKDLMVRNAEILVFPSIDMFSKATIMLPTGRINRAGNEVHRKVELSYNQLLSRNLVAKGTHLLINDAATQSDLKDGLIDGMFVNVDRLSTISIHDIDQVKSDYYYTVDFK